MKAAPAWTSAADTPPPEALPHRGEACGKAARLLAGPVREADGDDVGARVVRPLEELVADRAGLVEEGVEIGPVDREARRDLVAHSERCGSRVRVGDAGVQEIGTGRGDVPQDARAQGQL